MNILKIIKDADTGSTLLEPEQFEDRITARAVAFDKDNNVALIYSQKNNYHKLPGGGVEDGEDLETAMQRELIEEIGCVVENIKDLGIVEEYRNEVGLHQISYCYIADVVMKGIPKLEPNEIIEDYITKWIDLDTAIEILKKEGATKHYDGRFMQMRDITFLMEARDYIKRSVS